MKITMVIADDEQLSLKSEELLIRKEFPNIEIVGLAQNGIELKNAIEQLNPDAAIVDIRMPGITGLEAIELLHGKGCTTHFLVNTAYSDFEYIKKALDEKVDGYIVKPGKRNEIINSIEKMCQEIEKEKSELVNGQTIKSALDMMTPTYENELLLSIFTEHPSTEEFKQYCEVNKVDYKRSCITTLMQSAPSMSVDIKLLNQTLASVLNGICKFLSACSEDYMIVLLIIPNEIEKDRAKTWCGEVAQLIADEVGKVVNMEFDYGLGNIYTDFSQMKISYSESLGEFIEQENEKKLTCDSAENVKQYVSQAKGYIHNNYKEDKSLVDCAENVGISPFYLSHIFKDATGKTFVEYLSKVRMNEAKRLCTNSELSIREIAEQSGYSNITYFYKVFKRETGMTIGEYRKENKNV